MMYSVLVQITEKNLNGNAGLVHLDRIIDIGYALEATYRLSAEPALPTAWPVPF